MGATWRMLVSDSQLRWVGPEKGVTHLALGAIVNAVWDLWARVEGKPVWRFIADMSPEEVARCVDYRYLEDELDYERAVELLKAGREGRDERLQAIHRNEAVRAYTTSAGRFGQAERKNQGSNTITGWLGYDEEKMKRLLKKSIDEGYKHFKIKVGGSVEEDRKRLGIAREIMGYDNGNVLMVDANQVRTYLTHTFKLPSLTSGPRSGPYRRQYLT